MSNLGWFFLGFVGAFIIIAAIIIALAITGIVIHYKYLSKEVPNKKEPKLPKYHDNGYIIN
jgi:cytochrome b subunit of formate dehydrogenase